jgi:hypothetical protein
MHSVVARPFFRRKNQKKPFTRIRHSVLYVQHIGDKRIHRMMREDYMKRIIAAALVAGLAVAAAQAQTNQVLSRNAVGYERITVPTRDGGYRLVRLDFIGLGGDVTVSNMLGTQLPDGSQAVFYNEASQGYQVYGKNTRGWGVGNTAVVDTAQGFFLSGPTSAVPTNYQVYLMGEVPDRFTQPSNYIPSVGGPATPFRLSGYPFPVALQWTNVQLMNQLPANSQIVTFDGATYSVAAKHPTRGWPAPLMTNYLQVGQGFFIKTTTTVSWTETKPYTWP